ncbi:MAG: GFA family protein [Proteobacteria bacterium]|nr:MAG: GFA family protein [Pseudomonadota bacterium]
MEKYTGGCHCGRVNYEVSVDITQSITCNCSICRRRGSILAFTTADQFKLLKGEEELTNYQFGKHSIHHTFCKTCGILSHARGSTPDGHKMVAINVRCLDDVDIEALSPVAVDGASF